MLHLGNAIELKARVVPGVLELPAASLPEWLSPLKAPSPPRTRPRLLAWPLALSPRSLVKGGSYLRRGQHGIESQSDSLGTPCGGEESLQVALKTRMGTR